MIQIFAEEISDRLLYTLDFVFEEDYSVTSYLNDLKSGKILNYSKMEINDKDCVWIIPSGLLEHDTIEEDYQHNFEHQDLLSNIFYVLTRYEEYLTSEEDEHGRFPPSSSLQFQQGRLDEPIVDEWVAELRNRLELKTKFSYQFIPSFDIDNAWAYKNKGRLRTTAAKSKDLLKKDQNRLEERRHVLAGRQKDPYDTYDFMASLEKWNPRVFFLLGDFGKRDRNVNWKNQEFQDLIRSIDGFAEIGIHPSYDSYGKIGKVKQEKERLEEIVGHEIIRSRQHFLRMQLPKSYQILNEIGIKEDYSMGHAQHFGWRAGTSRSFYFFDLEKNCKTDLEIFPFQYMDGTLNEYLQLKPNNAKEVIAELTDKTQRFGGNFICLWHNETINDYGIWKGWKDVLNYNISLNE